MATTARDDGAPVLGILFERITLKRVDFVTDEAGDGHGDLLGWMRFMIQLARIVWFAYHRTMRDGPQIVGIAALVGDQARAEVLTALMADRALTATELAAVAGVTKQTISAHLAKLVDAGLVAVTSQGRHRYFRLADRDVAQLIESLMGV